MKWMISKWMEIAASLMTFVVVGSGDGYVCLGVVKGKSGNGEEKESKRGRNK